MNISGLYVWGYLTFEDIKNLGLPGTTAEKYEFLADLTSFKFHFNQDLGLGKVDEAKKQLSQRINVLRQAVYVTGKKIYFEALQNLCKDCSTYLPNTGFLNPLEDLLKTHNPKWITSFKKYCLLWEQCHPFAEQVKQQVPSAAEIFDNKDLQNKKFFYSAAKIYQLILEVKPLFKKFKHTLKEPSAAEDKIDPALEKNHPLKPHSVRRKNSDPDNKKGSSRHARLDTSNKTHSPRTSHLPPSEADFFTPRKVSSRLGAADEEWAILIAESSDPGMKYGQLCSWLQREAPTILETHNSNNQETNTEGSLYDLLDTIADNDRSLLKKFYIESKKSKQERNLQVFYDWVRKTYETVIVEAFATEENIDHPLIIPFIQKKCPQVWKEFIKLQNQIAADKQSEEFKLWQIAPSQQGLRESFKAEISEESEEPITFETYETKLWEKEISNKEYKNSLKSFYCWMKANSLDTFNFPNFKKFRDYIYFLRLQYKQNFPLASEELDKFEDKLTAWLIVENWELWVKYQAFLTMSLHEFVKQKKEASLSALIKPQDEKAELEEWLKHSYGGVLDSYKKYTKKFNLLNYITVKHPEIWRLFNTERSKRLNVEIEAVLKEKNPALLREHQDLPQMTLTQFLELNHLEWIKKFKIFSDTSHKDKKLMEDFKKSVIDAPGVWENFKKHLPKDCLSILRIKYRSEWQKFEAWQTQCKKNEQLKLFISFLKTNHSKQLVLLADFKKNRKSFLQFYVREMKPEIWREYSNYLAELKYLKLESLSCGAVSNTDSSPRSTSKGSHRFKRFSMARSEEHRPKSLRYEVTTLSQNFDIRRLVYIHLIRNNPYFYEHIIEALTRFSKTKSPENSHPLTEISFSLPLSEIQRYLQRADKAIKTQIESALWKYGTIETRDFLYFEMDQIELHNKLKKCKKEIRKEVLALLEALLPSGSGELISFKITTKELKEKTKKGCGFITEHAQLKTESTMHFNKSLEDPIKEPLKKEVVEFLTVLTRQFSPRLLNLTPEEVVEQLESEDFNIQKEIMEMIDRIPFESLPDFKIQREIKID